MTDNVTYLPLRLSVARPQRRSQPVDPDAEYLWSMAINNAAGDHDSALEALAEAIMFGRKRQLVARAYRLLGPPGEPPPDTPLDLTGGAKAALEQA